MMAKERRDRVEEQYQEDEIPEAELLEEEGLSDEVDQEEVERLKKELEEARSKSEEYLDGWQRSRAEFANYRKRVEREREQAQENAAGNAYRRFLDIADDLDRALKNRPQEGEGARWASGIELIYRKIQSMMEAEGIKTMEADGQQFDPNLHEAISQEESPDHASGEIIEVVQNGYVVGDRVLRPARVRVAR